MIGIFARPRLLPDHLATQRWPLLGSGLVAVALTFLSRAPFATVGGADDGFYAEVAHLWRTGFMPYAHAFDVKPPGIFAVLALVQSLVGESNLALRLIGWTSDAVTMAALIVFCQRRDVFGAGLAAAILYALLSPLILNDDAYNLLIAVTSLAVLLAMGAKPARQRAITAGLVIGAAGVIKQTAAFEGLAILAILMSEETSASARLKTAATFVASALVLPFVCALYFALNGGLTALLTDTIVIAVQRSSTTSMGEGIGKFLLFCLDIAPVLAIAVATIALRSRLPHFRRDIGALGLWLAASMLAVVVQHATFARYIGPMLPPSLLLAALGVSGYLASRPRDFRLLLILLMASFPAVSLWRFLTTPRTDMSGITRITEVIEAARPAPDDRLYVAVASAEAIWIYVASGLRAPTPFLIPRQQLCAFPNAGPIRIDEAFAARPRFVVVDRDWTEEGYSCEVPGVRDKVTAALARNYRLIAQTDGAAERFTLYEINAAVRPSND